MALFAVTVALGSLVVGVLGGLLGVGGGVFLVPFLVAAVSLSPQQAVAASLCAVIGTSASSSFVGARNGLTRLDVALRLEPFLVLGAVVTSALATRVTDGALLIGFGVLLVVVVLLVLARQRAVVVENASLSKRRQATLAAAAAASGAASGLFGVGGGVLVVPALMLIGRLPVKQAAATSSACLMTSAACAAVVHWSHGNLRVDVVAWAMLGVLPGGIVGARLQRRVPERALQLAFFVLTSIVAAMSIWRGVTA